MIMTTLSDDVILIAEMYLFFGRNIPNCDGDDMATLKLVMCKFQSFHLLVIVH